MAREITYNNFEIPLMVFMSNISTNDAITYKYFLHKTVIFYTWLFNKVDKHCPEYQSYNYISAWKMHLTKKSKIWQVAQHLENYSEETETCVYYADTWLSS